MRAYWLIILWAFCCGSAKAQFKKSIAVGYVENYEKQPKIKFTKSSKAEYEQCKKSSEPVKLKIKESKTNFILTTKAKSFKLKKTNSEENNFDGYEYIGYYKKLKMYAFTENTMSDNLGFGTFALLDSVNANYYNIISIGDGAIETPIQSPNGKYLVYYYNRLYDGDSSFIGLLEVNRNGKPSQVFKEKQSYDTEHFAVEGIKWLNDKTLIVKAYHTVKKDGNRETIIQYYKASIQ